MELRLTFREQEIRDIYNDSFELEEQQLARRIKERVKGSITLASVSSFFFLLTYFHSDWVYYGVFFALLTIIFSAWTQVVKQKYENKIFEERNSIDGYLVKYRTIDNIMYVYDDEKIRYFESDQLTTEIKWIDIIGVVKNEKWIYVRFRNLEQNIWIPRVTVDEQDIVLFEQTIDESDRSKRFAGTSCHLDQRTRTVRFEGDFEIIDRVYLAVS